MNAFYSDRFLSRMQTAGPTKSELCRRRLVDAFGNGEGLQTVECGWVHGAVVKESDLRPLVQIPITSYSDTAYTDIYMVGQKRKPPTSVRVFAKCRPIFKFFHCNILRKKIQ